MTFSFSVFFSLSPFAQFFFFSPPALLFIQWFITEVSFMAWSSSLLLLLLPLLALLLETLYEKCMPLFKCIDSTHRRPRSFLPLACQSLKKFQNKEKWTLFWQSNSWMHLTKSKIRTLYSHCTRWSSKVCLYKTEKYSNIRLHAHFNLCFHTGTFLRTLNHTKLQTYCSFWRPERIGEFHQFYCHSQ